MANLTESQTWESGVYQVETSDKVIGGAGDIINKAAGQLANRTVFLKAKTDALDAPAMLQQNDIATVLQMLVDH